MLRACLGVVLGCAVVVAAVVAAARVLRQAQHADAGASAALSSSPSAAPAGAPALTLLLIGNSHSQPLVGLLRELAAADGIAVQIDGLTPGGRTLAQHAAAPATFEKIRARRYDVITLQEQGQVPAWSEGERDAKMNPAGVELARAIREAGAAPWVYATYARPGGDPGNTPGDSYEAMQTRSDEGYAELARRIDAKVIPVGAAFRTARAMRPDLALWNPDGVHASRAGYYLAACVFHAVLLQRDPRSVAHDGGLPPADAAFLRAIASHFVVPG